MPSSKLTKSPFPTGEKKPHGRTAGVLGGCHAATGHRPGRSIHADQAVSGQEVGAICEAVKVLGLRNDLFLTYVRPRWAELISLTSARCAKRRSSALGAARFLRGVGRTEARKRGGCFASFYIIYIYIYMCVCVLGSEC